MGNFLFKLFYFEVVIVNEKRREIHPTANNNNRTKDQRKKKLWVIPTKKLENDLI